MRHSRKIRNDMHGEKFICIGRYQGTGETHHPRLHKEWTCERYNGDALSRSLLSRDDKTTRNENGECTRGITSASRYPLRPHDASLFCNKEFSYFSSISSVSKGANFAVFAIYLLGKVIVLSYTALWLVWHLERTMLFILCNSYVTELFCVILFRYFY